MATPLDIHLSRTGSMEIRSGDRTVHIGSGSGGGDGADDVGDESGGVSGDERFRELLLPTDEPNVDSPSLSTSRAVDEFLEAPKPGARLRAGHDEAILRDMAQVAPHRIDQGSIVGTGDQHDRVGVIEQLR